MPIDRRRFLACSALAALAAAAPSLARERTAGSLSLGFASFPGIGSLAGAKLANAIWSGATVKARVRESLPVQLLAARFEGSKAVDAFASPVAKLAPGDAGGSLAKFLPGDMYFPGDMFLPGDLFLPGDMYLPGDMFLAGDMFGTERERKFGNGDASERLGGAVSKSPGFRSKGLVLFAFALVGPGSGLDARGLVFELDRR